MTPTEVKEIPLGIRLYHLTESDDWVTIQSMADDIMDTEMRKCMNEKDKEKRNVMMDNLICYKEFWAKFRSKILNTVTTPNEKETY